MNQSTFSVLKLFPIALVITLAVVGCKSKEQIAAKPKEAWRDTFFPDPKEPNPVEVTMARQAANGARADGMLHAIHFDDDALNSLGRDKLERMVLATPVGSKLKVFVNVPDNDSTAPRLANIENFLGEQGLAKDQIAVARGTNPAALGDTTDSIVARKAQRDGTGDTAGGDVGIGIGISK